MPLFAKEKCLLAIAACLVLVTQTAMADSMLSPSTTYYFGFDRETTLGVPDYTDGTTLYGIGNSGTTEYDTTFAPDARTAFLNDPSLAGLPYGFAVGIEDFESAPVGEIDPELALTFAGAGVTGTLTPDADGGVEVRQIEPPGMTGHIAGRYPTSGTKYVDTNNEDSETEMTVTFDDPVVGFGFYATDSGDFDGRLKLIITQVDGMGTSEYYITLDSPTGNIDREDDTYPAPGEPYNASLLFFGLVDVLKPIKSVTFVNVPDGSYVNPPFPGDDWNDDNYGFDELIAVTPVPEPATFGLLLLGGTALLGYSRRRSRSNAA